MPRLFVAIDLPETLRARLAGLCSGIEGARWVAPENMHLTLRFIGEVPAADADDIAHTLTRVRAPDFALTLAGVGYFGARRRVRAIWAGVERNPALEDLHRRVDAALRHAKISPDARKFSPHLTLARFRDVRPARVAPWIEAHSLFRAEPFPVHGFSLYSSLLGSGDPVYRDEAKFLLQNNEIAGLS